MDLPLFPLHTVLFPGIAMPLHIFEDRYRLLTERSLDAPAPFGIVLIREGREVGLGSVTLAAVGTLAEIREARRHPDGRFDIVAVGTGRFRIGSVAVGREPYLVGEVEPLEDEIGDQSRAHELAAAASRQFVRYVELLKPADDESGTELEIEVEIEAPSTESQPSEAETGNLIRRSPLEETARSLAIPDDPTILSYLLSGILQVDPPQRQALLEADTTEVRLAALLRVLDREIWLLRQRLASYTPQPGLVAARRN
jgi:Lon protease-like protein